MEDLLLKQIYGTDGEELGLVTTNMTEKELKEAVRKIDADDEYNMDCFEKFEEYANTLDKSCTRVYVDGTVNL